MTGLFCKFRPHPRRVVGTVVLINVMLMSGVAASREPADWVHHQQQDIDALIRELDYLIEHTERMAARYREDKAPIRFNYPALLEQLRLTRARTAAYLNEAHEVLLYAPPPPESASLTQRR